MNRFKHINTAIIKSDLDFSKLENHDVLNGNANLSVSVGTPKRLEENKQIRCKAEFSFEGEDNAVKINVNTVSFFEIEEPIEEQNLREDANKICGRLATVELAQKVARITELHIGKTLNIPIPDDE